MMALGFSCEGEVARCHRLAAGGPPDRCREVLIASGDPARLLDAADKLVAGGQFRQARQLADAALERARDLGDLSSQGRAGYTLYLAAWTSSSYLDALRYIQLTDRLAQASGDRSLRWRARVALFETLYELGSLDAARAVIDEAAATVADRGVEGWRDITFRRGVLEQELGRIAIARQAYQQSLRLNAQAARPSRPLAWAAQVNLLELALEEQDSAAAARELAAATDLFNREQSHRPVARAVFAYEEARFRLLNRQHAEAGAALDRAVAASPPAEIGWRLDLLRGELTENLGDLPAAEQHYRSAVLTIRRLAAELKSDDLKTSVMAAKEKAFGRLFAVRLAQGRARDALEVVEWARSRAVLDELGRPPAGASDGPDREGGAIDDRAHLVERFLPRLRQRLAQTAPPPPLEEALVRLRSRQVLVYYAQAGSLFLLEVRGQTVRAHHLATGLEEIVRLADALTADPDSPELATRLGNALLPRDLNLATTVFVAPSAELAAVSFAALRPGGQLLIDRAAVSYVPSVGALIAAEARPTTANRSALVLGDPAGDLPGSAAESRAVARLLATQPQLGATATSARLRVAEQPHLLHLSAHSGTGFRGPWVQLADGRLHGADLLDSGLRPRIAVLASCGSAATRQPGLWGSLAATFFAAGSTTVIGSLRALDDRIAADLILDFYRANGAEAPVQALASVQRVWARRQPPSRWAYVVAVGPEPTTRENGDKQDVDDAR
jgi:tetratricopeptide (TPR) repeat protein